MIVFMHTYIPVLHTFMYSRIPTCKMISTFNKAVALGVFVLELKPDYHWILNQVKDGEVTGASGKKFLAKGGIRLNHDSIGFDGVATYMDGGDYAGTCVSGMYAELKW